MHLFKLHLSYLLLPSICSRVLNTRRWNSDIWLWNNLLSLSNPGFRGFTSWLTFVWFASIIVKKESKLYAVTDCDLLHSQRYVLLWGITITSITVIVCPYLWPVSLINLRVAFTGHGPCGRKSLPLTILFHLGGGGRLTIRLTISYWEQVHTIVQDYGLWPRYETQGCMIPWLSLLLQEWGRTHELSSTYSTIDEGSSTYDPSRRPISKFPPEHARLVDVKRLLLNMNPFIIKKVLSGQFDGNFDCVRKSHDGSLLVNISQFNS